MNRLEAPPPNGPYDRSLQWDDSPYDIATLFSRQPIASDFLSEFVKSYAHRDVPSRHRDWIKVGKSGLSTTSIKKVHEDDKIGPVVYCKRRWLIHLGNCTFLCLRRRTTRARLV